MNGIKTLQQVVFRKVRRSSHNCFPDHHNVERVPVGFEFFFEAL